MARYNEILVGRYNRRLQKLLGMKGEPPAPQLSTEIQANLMLFSGKEERYLEGWNHFGGSITAGPVAAVNSGMRLRNPLTSGVIAVVEKLMYGEVAADSYVFNHGPQAADLAGIVSGTVLRFDPRGATNPACVLSNATTVASFAQVKGNMLAPANSSVDFIADTEHQFVIAPGDAAQIITIAVNVQLLCLIWWRERILEESERA